MYKQAVSEQTQRVLAKIGKPLAQNFYLAGGTALAIQLGHRLSIDLDWFSGKSFLNEPLKVKLTKFGEFELTGEDEDTVHGILDNVRVSFLRYGYALMFSLVDFEGAKLADERDIAAMKIDAMSSRGSKKDFVDLYFLLEKYSLPELIAFFEKKYANIKFNKLHILKSLTYFEDADGDPMPEMLKKCEWGEIKEKITAETNKILET